MNSVFVLGSQVCVLDKKVNIEKTYLTDYTLIQDLGDLCKKGCDQLLQLLGIVVSMLYLKHRRYVGNDSNCKAHS